MLTGVLLTLGTIAGTIIVLAGLYLLALKILDDNLGGD